MTQLVECIPNFSEGRRRDVVDAIVNAISAVQGVTLLDRSSDPDHNRSVITFAGPPGAVSEAAFAAITKAAGLINLDQHSGEHPRLGATDVVPFVPLDGIEMAECVQLARDLGRRVGEELGIPVYLYEEAATRPNRVNLEDVRRGEYEALKTAIASDPNRAPDFGPAQVGPAGATIIGAREALIAFNAYLTSGDVMIAQKIARAVRHSSGGLRYVKGLGLLVEGRAQVSMNLTNYHRTPIYRAVELVRREAERYGVAIHHTELVGLIPQRALINAARWYMQLDDFSHDQVLENKLRSAAAAGPSGGDSAAFLDALAAGTATPGGGAAAAYSGAMGAALVAMVARVTMGKKGYAEAQARMAEIAAEADHLRAVLEDAVRQDSAAFEGVMAAYRLPKGSDDEKAARAASIEQAMHHAAEVPLEVCRMAVRVLALAAEAAVAGNANAVSDAGSAGAMAYASLTAAGMNVRINAKDVTDRAAAQGWLEALAELEIQARTHRDRLHAAIHDRGGIEV